MQIEFDDIPYRKFTNTPTLSHCRRLIKQGVDPSTKLEVTRNGRVDLTIRTIAEGAALTVKEEPTVHFTQYEDKFKNITTAKRL